MSQKNISELIIVSPVLLFLRRHINILCLLLFLFYTKGHAFYALRISISMVMFRYLRKDELGQPFGPEIVEYQQLYSVYHMDLLAGTLSAAATVIMIGAILVWFTDAVGSYKSCMTREARHMRYWTRQEIKRLAQGRLIASLDSAQELKTRTLDVIVKMDEILLRYEKMARAIYPDRIVNDKLSDREKTLGDLFDEVNFQASPPKPPREPKASIKFKFRR